MKVRFYYKNPFINEVSASAYDVIDCSCSLEPFRHFLTLLGVGVWFIFNLTTTLPHVFTFLVYHLETKQRVKKINQATKVTVSLNNTQ